MIFSCLLQVNEHGFICSRDISERIDSEPLLDFP